MARAGQQNMMGWLLLTLGVAGIGLGCLWPETNHLLENNQSLETLKTEVAALTTQQNNLREQIQRYEQEKQIPPDLIIRTFDENTRAQVLKEMLDKVVNIASNTQNAFISLEPLDDGKAAAAPPPPPAAPATPPTDPNAPPPPPPAPSLVTYTYNMAIRGSYNDIMRFLAALNDIMS
jgi:hypothetical protein